MNLGIFEAVFSRPSLGAKLDAATEHGLHLVQFDFASAGLESLPDEIPHAVAEHVRRATVARGIRIAAVSGTYNMIHPDPRVRDRGLASLRAIAAACHAMGTSVITLCTGTRDPDSMWRRHPDNDARDAWDDLLASLADVLAIADEYDVTFALEPEPANVARNAVLGRKLLDELNHPRLKVVMDPANIVASDRERSPMVVLDEAFDLLGDDLALAHAKDLSVEGRFCAAGHGIVPWDHYLSRLQRAGFEGAIILHTLTEADVSAAAAMLHQIWDQQDDV